MNFSFLRSRTGPLLALACTLGLGSAQAATSPLDSLLANSPFAVVKSGQAADAGTQPLEFRGVSEEKGGPFFSILDTATKRSRWVVMNDPSDDFVVKSYDADAHTVSLDQHGRVLSLTLKSGPRIVQNVPPPMPPGSNGQPGVTMPNGGGKGAEAQRLQQIAEEIRRRRALRQQPPQMPMPNPNTAPGAYGPTPMPGAGTGGPMPIPGNGTGPSPIPNPTPGTNSGPTPNYPPQS